MLFYNEPPSSLLLTQCACNYIQLLVFCTHFMCCALLLNISTYFSIENWQTISKEAGNRNLLVFEKTEILTMILVKLSLSLNTNFIISIHTVTFTLYFVPIKIFIKDISFHLFSVPIKLYLKSS